MGLVLVLPTTTQHLRLIAPVEMLRDSQKNEIAVIARGREKSLFTQNKSSGSPENFLGLKKKVHTIFIHIKQIILKQAKLSQSLCGFEKQSFCPNIFVMLQFLCWGDSGSPHDMLSQALITPNWVSLPYLLFFFSCDTKSSPFYLYYFVVNFLLAVWNSLFFFNFPSYKSSKLLDVPSQTIKSYSLKIL